MVRMKYDKVFQLKKLSFPIWDKLALVLLPALSLFTSLRWAETEAVNCPEEHPQVFDHP